MATTGSRAGFRLPWNAEERDTTERAEPGDADEQSPQDTRAAMPDGSAESSPVGVEATAVDAVAQADDVAAAADGVEYAVEHAWRPTMVSPESPSPVQPVDPATEWAIGPGEDAAVLLPANDLNRPAVVPSRRPTKFLADLTRAMQAAAETSRSSTLDQLQIDCKAHIERMYARSAELSASFRARADTDIVAIRDWSKAEIARIREETDGRIAGRKSSLEGELTVHSEETEREIGRAQATVMEFEAEMAQFFERLLAEEDPAEFAALASRLPEPPDFEQASVPADAPSSAPATRNGRAAIDAVDATVPADAPLLAIVDESPAAPAEQAEPVATEEVRQIDPRLAALGLTADFDSAEAEAAADAADRSYDAEPEIQTISDDALAARLAGLVPERTNLVGEDDAPGASPVSSQVVVTGLISVASIAGFKRQLGRLAGVRSVGVSSGPDGEFVFTIGHDAELKPADLVPLVSGFEARVTGAAEGIVHVTARDPETEA